jgi:L-fuconolactonase
MKSVSQNPKAWIKISGLGMCTADLQSWNPDELQPYIEFCLEHFGPERTVRGGDWPVVELCGGYSKSWQAYEEILSRSLSSKEMVRIFGENAVLFYGLT